MIFDKKIYFVFFGISVLAGLATAIRSGEFLHFPVVVIGLSFLSFLFITSVQLALILMYESFRRFIRVYNAHTQ